MRMLSPSRLLWFGSLALALLLTGCKGWSLSQCVSPRVTGRVLDGETRQPLERVEVQRVGTRPHRPTDEPAKGGTLMQRAPRIVLSSADGSFTLDAIYSVAAFQVLSWSSVNVQFRHAGYLALTTNLTSSLESLDSGGGPCINAGDVLLQRQKSTDFTPGSP